jgi:Zn-finger nucleic acid-binding protein
MNKETCKYCYGTGEWNKIFACPHCNGYGYILWRDRTEPKKLINNKPSGAYARDRNFNQSTQ